MTNLTSTLGTLAALIAALASPVAAVADPAADFAQAQSRYEAGHYVQAWAGFARLADEGHAEAARIALQMRQFGPRLYGTSFTAGPKQLERWRATLSRDAASKPAAPATARPIDAEREIWRHQGVG